MQKAWELRKQYSFDFGVCISYSWSYFKANYSQYFEIEFKKKNGEITKRIGRDIENKAQGLVFYSITDSKYKTAKPKNILSLKACNLEVKTK